MMREIKKDNRHLFYLDIRQEKCPMTFVRARLALEKLPANRQLILDLHSQETLHNVSYSIEEFGFKIVNHTQLDDQDWQLLIEHS